MGWPFATLSPEMLSQVVDLSSAQKMGNELYSLYGKAMAGSRTSTFSLNKGSMS